LFGERVKAALMGDVNLLKQSALNDQAMILAALHAGAHGFLGKPFNETSLNRALAELLK
jgi:FixJ family two-component response regulator